ncbi:hypothetical protein Lalb_Chr09g0327651 [Lupinus albus]|uniref:TOD1/MUCI70 glycosyltransferase-like domain-containing protein n=1 Tax=Lupinus albus TaxID=3870 RepID=A0A6A4Q0S8_LUPAL|nr:hypothetical protein Lalb_Chr09g0327651 [Lupinus albus]
MVGGGSLGIRSASYGSLDKHQLQIQTATLAAIAAAASARKASKMVKEKEKERLFLWICKFAGRKRVGMLFLCLISAAVFIWVLFMAKGEDSQEGNGVQSISVDDRVSIPDSLSLISTAANAIGLSTNLALPSFPPPPRSYFLGYHLPPGHPCNSFTLPPPPADKKRTGPRPCPVCYLPVEEAIERMPKFPSPSPVLNNLTFIHEENLSRDGEFGGSEFGGFPTLKQRNDSYNIQESMSVHCGFVRGIQPGRNTGFDIDENDLLEMEQCNGVVVASAIFGNFDEINEPKHISDHSKRTVCFIMFVDEVTEKYLSSGKLGISKKIGLWRVIIVRNLPYKDARRTGKIPKLLLHRLVPNARYSIWIDGKLELVEDPYRILERFLWRTNATFAISKHYKRFDVFLEAEANKAAAKYDNASIDFQIDFYKKEGLTPYTEAKLPLISDVPEGCVIVREHVPITNLFTCLWFNEVDRFTSRDQISFSTARDKILSRVDFHFHMFLDCERRNFVIQKYHRDILLHLAPPHAHTHPPPPSPPPPPFSMLETSLPEKVVTSPIRKGPGRRGRDRRSGSRHHRKVVAGSKDIEAR